MAEFIDPVCVPDIFATDLVSVEDLGGVFRYSFAACQNGELLIVARIALLTANLPKARAMSGEMIDKSADPALMVLRVHH